MARRITVGLVGNYDASVPAHRAIPLALKTAAESLAIDIEHEWIPTEEVVSIDRVSSCAGLWCIPASPYRSMEGALLAIRHARESRTPFIGTCGGFQHAVIEYARNVLGWSDATHGEGAPGAGRVVIAPLACALINEVGAIRLTPGSRLATAYGATEAAEEYLCSYGVNAEFQSALVAGPLRAVARDPAGDLRGVELDGHPFYVATLFQPERAALKGRPAPLVTAFARACSGVSSSR
jgi:CTP synthase (UTP-ammonia lyase)